MGMLGIVTGALPVLAPHPGRESEMMMVAANDGSQVAAADELYVDDSDANDLFIDLDDFWRVMGPPESPQGARLEDLPSVDTVKGEETTDAFSTDQLQGFGEQNMQYNSEDTEPWKGLSESEGLQLSHETSQGNGPFYSVTDNGLQYPLSSYQNDNKQASFETINHSQPSNFRSMSHVIRNQRYLDLTATGKAPFDAPSDFEAQDEDLFESTGCNDMRAFANDWNPSGDFVTRATDVASCVIDKMHYAGLGQDQMSSSEVIECAPPKYLSLMSCSNTVHLPKDEIKVDSRADHEWPHASNAKMEMNSVKMEKEMPKSTFVNKVLRYSSVFPDPSIKMGSELLKTYHEAQDTDSDICIIEDDSDTDSDICILESMRAPAPPNRVMVNAESVVTSQYSTSRNLAVQTVTTHSRYTPNDERTIFRVALQDLTQPKSQANPPDGVLSVPLLKHQRIALSWMVNKETKSACCSGGILADDQGLGKTISTIALILKERSPSSKCSKTNEKQRQIETLNLDDDDDVVFEAEPPQVNGCMNSSLAKGRPSGGTLIVCPTSVMRQWSEELHNKVTSEADLSVLVYYGSARTKDPIELAKYDVVVTTYAIVSMEVPKQPIVNGDEDQMDSKYKELSSSKKRKLLGNSSSSKKRRKGNDSELLEDTSGPLAQVGWFRVVLDEAQCIKNHRTQAARACWGLRAKRRWCLSGTPIQNTIDDLYSYFRFLRHEPYAVFKTFRDQLKVPINRNPRDGYKKLQAVLKTVMLRRTKGLTLLLYGTDGTYIDGEPIINLPPKTIELRKIEFSEEERAFYCKLEADSRAQFAEYAAAGTVKQNYINILLMLLRLRQTCDHPRLVKGFSSSSKMRSSTEMTNKLSREKQTSLLSCLEASLAICGVCSDPPEDAVVTACGHVFCHQCICEHLIGDGAQCPSKKCKTNLSMASVFSRATLRTSLSDQSGTETTTSSTGSCSAEVSKPHSLTTPQYSSKIDAALRILLALSSEKAIVFSQWTGMLDLLETSLNDNNIQYRRLDGTMPVAVRDRAVKDFKSDPQVTVMIMSLKAASLGLNLVAACKVILLDLWWNPTTEDQAIDRAHRIGQTNPVSVYRLTVKDTVEDRILALQERKRKMVSSAFGEDESGTRQSRLTVDDLMYLFNVK